MFTKKELAMDLMKIILPELPGSAIEYLIGYAEGWIACTEKQAITTCKELP